MRSAGRHRAAHPHGMAHPRQGPHLCMLRRALRDRRAAFDSAGAYRAGRVWSALHTGALRPRPRSEEHTSELQSLTNLVCRLLLEKKKKKKPNKSTIQKHTQISL